MSRTCSKTYYNIQNNLQISDSSSFLKTNNLNKNTILPFPKNDFYDIKIKNFDEIIEKNNTNELRYDVEEEEEEELDLEDYLRFDSSKSVIIIL